MEYSYLLADIGGSKTLLRVVDGENNVLHEAKLCGYGLAADSDEPISELKNKLGELAENFSPTAATVNLGGRNQRQIELTFATALVNTPIYVYRESEGSAALALAEYYDADTVLLAGTGSIAISTDRRGNYVIAGGWGCMVGDGGSGYSIGSALVRKALEELDGSAPLSDAAKAVTGFSEPFTALRSTAEYRDLRDSVRDHIGKPERSKLASYARLAAKLADNGDGFACSLFENAGYELAGLVHNAARKLRLDGSVGDIVVTGGLVSSRRHWQKSFEAALGQPRVEYSSDGLMLGLFKLAKKVSLKEVK